MYEELEPVDRMVIRSRQLAALQAAILSDVVAVADASPAPEFASMEIAAAMALTRQSAAAQVELAHTVVVRLPQVHAAMARGDLDLARARVFADALAALDISTARAVCDTALPDAGRLTAAQLRARLAKLAIEADPDACAVRHRQRVRDRRLVVEPGPDSTASLCLYDLPADRAAAAANHVRDVALGLKQAGDARTMDQLRADIAIDLLLGNQPASGKGRGAVELVASLETLARLTEEPGDLAGYGPVIADIARAVAQQQRDGQWGFTIYDKATGTLHTGLTSRRPTEDLARHIRHRDRTCRFPGCRIPARRTDIDHTVAVERGGPTHHGNLGCLCRWHHRGKHTAGWKLAQPRPGHFIWRSPLGKIYRIDPEPP